MDISLTTLTGLAAATALGMLVGFQREWVANKPIGLRSFAIIGVLGGLIGLLSESYGGWVMAAGYLAITLTVLSQTVLTASRAPDTGMTTELAALAVFTVGILCTTGHLRVAVVVGGAITLLLHWKQPMHKSVHQIGESEVQAIMRFILVSMIVLPLLPDQTYGPYQVFNPWVTWLMVVLIVGLNLAGYIALKLFSGKGGAFFGGILGGLISSTATTVSFATRCRDQASMAAAASVIILTASSLVYIRIFIEVAAVAPSLIAAIAWPSLAFLALFGTTIAWYARRIEPIEQDGGEPANPAQLTSALTFALLYCVVLLISAAANEHVGQSMLYPVAIISGLTDVDAITLSTANLYAANRIDTETAWRVIFVASLSNLVFKAGVVAVLGGPELRKRLLPGMSCLAAIGYVGVTFWP